MAALTAALAVAACGGGSDGNPQGELTVFAASSLREVFPAIDSRPLYSFAGSDQLATQIREGAPADVYAAASPKYQEELYGEGLVDEPVVFATNRLVLIVPAANPGGVDSVGDLADAGVKLVIAAQGVPIGDYTRAAIETLGLADALDNVVSEEDDVKGVVAKVALGEADAGFVYATDAAPVASDVKLIEIPADAQPVIQYEVAVVSSSDHATEAEAFVERLLTDEGRTALERAGFGVP